MFTSVFDRPLKSGDTILYWYKSYDSMRYCIGQISSIKVGKGWYDSKVYINRIHEKDYGDWKAVSIKKTSLQSPECLVVGPEVQMPSFSKE